MTGDDPDAAPDTIDEGKRLVRLGGDTGLSLAERLSERFGANPTLVVCGGVQIAALVVLGTVRDLPAAAAAFGVFGLAGMVWNVIEVTMIQRRSPAEALGRVTAALRTVAVGVSAPLGALLGGVIAAGWGLGAPALFGAVLFVASVAVLVPGLRAGMN